MGKKKFRPRAGARRHGPNNGNGGYQGGGFGGGYNDRGGGGYGGGGGGGYGGGGGGGGGGYRGRRGGGGGRRRPRQDFGDNILDENGQPIPQDQAPGAEGDFEQAPAPVEIGPDGLPIEGQAPVMESRPAPPEIPLVEGSGLLEMHPNGYGFLRSPDNMYTRERSDPFVPGTMIEKFRLRQGVMIRGMVQPGRRQQGPRIREILDVDGMKPEEYASVKSFDQKTPINPELWYRLETGAQPLTTRVMDLLTPVGRGQRALIVAPPRSGKTILLQHISHGIATNYPEVKLMVLLVDERPEEVTDMRRNIKGEVVASSLDMDVESHVRLSQLVIERCKRLAEMGKDVFLLLDSITRLARAFNKWVGDTGRGGRGIQTGGLDTKAMDIPKKLFATARAFEEGGSLTIVGTALIDTNSRMDDAIFQEFKGTGNMEMVLDKKLAERRVYPAIDISQSGTRREELLLPPENLAAVVALRRTLTSMNPVDAMEQLTRQLGRFKTNTEFIKLISGTRLND